MQQTRRIRVKKYQRRDGTVVRSHQRTNPFTKILKRGSDTCNLCGHKRSNLKLQQLQETFNFDQEELKHICVNPKCIFYPIKNKIKRK